MKNTEYSLTAVFASALISFGTIAFADEAAPAKTLTAVPEKDISFTGDSIVLGENVPKFEIVDAANNQNTTVTAPRGARFHVTNELTDSGGNIYLEGSFDTCGAYWYTSCNSAVVATDCPGPGVKEQKICGGWQYRVRKNDLITRDYRKYGYTYGIMIIPFKAFFSDRSIGTGSTIGPYIGWGTSGPGIKTAWAISAGLVSIPVTTKQADGTASTQNQTGLSYAVGYLATIKDAFHLGVFIGRDSLSKTSPYQYNNKTWVGLQFAYGIN